MLIEKLFYLMNKLHHYFIAKYSQNLEFNYLIDVGAHKGEFLSSFIKFKKIKKYFCFEPQKDIFNVLKKDYKSRKIKYFNHALGEKKKKTKIYISSLSSTSTMSTFDKKSKYLKFKNFILKNKSNSYKTHFIQQKTIDEVFKNKDLTNCFLKIDVEGYEINVLLGAKKKIKEIKYVLVEHQLFNQYKNDFKKVKRFLINNNFEIAQNFYFPTLHYKDVLFKKNKKNAKKQ